MQKAESRSRSDWWPQNFFCWEFSRIWSNSEEPLATGINTVTCASEKGELRLRVKVPCFPLILVGCFWSGWGEWPGSDTSWKPEKPVLGLMGSIISAFGS